MSTESAIPVEGKIVSILPGTMFRVELPNKQVVLAHISGKMRKRFIRLNLGDRVKLEMSPYDLSKARIVYRLGGPRSSVKKLTSPHFCNERDSVSVCVLQVPFPMTQRQRKTACFQGSLSRKSIGL